MGILKTSSGHTKKAIFIFCRREELGWVVSKKRSESERSGKNKDVKVTRPLRITSKN
jgi:hypothetical protein